MPIRLPTSLVISLALITSACSEPMKTPDIKQNPHPTKRYEVTVTIEGAPGPFDLVSAFAQYEVKNTECVPLQPGSGARLTPNKSISLQLAKIGNIYKSSFNIDQLRDEDYFGLGVCHWSVVAVSADLKVKSSTFSSAIFNDEIHSGKTFFRYFSDRAYNDLGMTGVDIGNANRADFKEDANKTFSVSLAIKEAQP